MELAGGQENRIQCIEQYYGISGQMLLHLAGDVSARNSDIFLGFINVDGVLDVNAADAHFLKRTRAFIGKFFDTRVPTEVKSFLRHLVASGQYGIQVNGSLARTGGMTDDEFWDYAKTADMDLNLHRLLEQRISPEEIFSAISTTMKTFLPDAKVSIYNLFPNGQAFAQYSRPGTPFVLAVDHNGFKFSFALTPRLDANGDVYIDTAAERMIDDPKSANFRAPDTFNNNFRLAVKDDELVIAEEQLSREKFLRTLLYTTTGGALELVAYPKDSKASKPVLTDSFLYEYLLVQREKMKGRAIFSYEIQELLRNGPRGAEAVFAHQGRLIVVPEIVGQILTRDKNQYADLNMLLSVARLARHYGWNGSDADNDIATIVQEFLLVNGGKTIQLDAKRVELPSLVGSDDIGLLASELQKVLAELGLQPEFQDAFMGLHVKPQAEKDIFIRWNSGDKLTPESYTLKTMSLIQSGVFALSELALIYGIYEGVKNDTSLMVCAPMFLLLNMLLIHYFRNQALRANMESARNVYLGPEAVKAANTYEQTYGFKL